MKFSCFTTLFFLAATTAAVVSAASLSSAQYDDIGEICIQSIVPCPKECPTTCIYPNLPCPKQYTPHCPPPPARRHNQRKSKTKRDNSDFITMVFADDVPNGSICSDHLCSLIYKPCPKECPSNCEFINPTHPCCPFSGETVCPLL